MELHYVKLFFTFTLNEDLADPYALYACRSDFDAAFRRAISCRRLDCTGCPSVASCPYPANFGQKIARDPDAVKRHQKPPLPFVFEFPVLLPTPNGGSSFECSLTLFGSAVQHLGCYLAAVKLLLDGMHASLVKVEAECPGGARTAIAAGNHPALPLLSALDPTGAGPLLPDRVAVCFVTPLKLTHEGRLLRRFSFSELARVLMRRVSSLAYYYEGVELPLDYRWLSLASEAVRTLDSNCRLQSWSGRPAGLVGAACFEGDLEPFHLLLQLGSATHLGKGASFGFGAYRLERC
ncbi:MAG TPA: CRISPR system precrRNA processing endoribonuclease RAMP protein Cas6 [Geomonas sp.]